ncbi:SDR family oxidoreductase [Schumannella luteola]|uniref:NAD(P)-dependent dehydrogenase (Short-subunit alcohol dehydrogenase family) n=1 Tax=Schumannella luteola TaxID=472059 RepID=A0A852Y8W1_9MICO|nr:SDR family oxidoreductase [Schumannella luteola]NYG97661.1 NAD(P)-dependent dehydrogenase (short-subunit alcohol dehydrogenase family) [Schumannella luteola]TPW91314.1 SDR family oxidoreductase [Schumannella luteola]
MTDSSTTPHGTAIITGAGSERGIGRELANRLAPAGWSLALLDRDADAVAALAAELAEAHGIQALGLAADVADPASVDAAITEVEAKLPAVQALVNIAGISSPIPFLELDLATWERVLRVNATGTFVVTQRVMPGLVERKYGRVVNLGSTAMQNGGGTYSKSSYAASKGAVDAFSRAVALEMAPHGVTVNVVAPATIDTDIMGGRITDDRAPQFLAQLPVGRLGTTREVAALIDFLIGEEAGYITGATYNINGGIRIG